MRFLYSINDCNLLYYHFKPLRPFEGYVWIAPHCFDFTTLILVCNSLQKKYSFNDICIFSF